MEILKTVFIPSNEYFQGKFNMIKTKLNDKLEYAGLVAQIENLKVIKGSDLQDIEIDIMGVHAKILDAKYVNVVKAEIHEWVRGLMFILLLVYNINQIYLLIRGVPLFAPGFSSGQKMITGGKD